MATNRGHCPGAGRLIQYSRGSASSMKRNAVNRNGGISRRARAEVRKLPAQARTMSRTRRRSRGGMLFASSDLVFKRGGAADCDAAFVHYSRRRESAKPCLCSSSQRMLGSSAFAVFQVQGFRLRRVTFFAGTKKVTKEMPLEGPKRNGGSDVAGIFRLAILARSENGAHPCAPPFGSAWFCGARSFFK